jgi:hypothetical protein
MAKIIHKSNFRVVVEPKRLGDYGNIKISDNALYDEQRAQKEYQRRCEEMVEQIKRHVDNVDRVEVDFDVEYTCSHCEQEWTTDEAGCPLCCEEAEQEYLAGKKQIVNQ